MAAKIYRINYKSDFILTMNSDAGWAVPFCIKFWTSIPSRAYYVGYDGETYTHCAYDPSEPTKLVVQFDDHHLPIGDLHFQISYHFTVDDFPNNTEDEVFNEAALTTEIDGETYQVMLDFNGETAPGIDFSLPSVGVTSVNGKVGVVTLTAEDVCAQPTITDLSTIRSGAAAGATAVQPATLQEGLATKQDVISDLSTIRSGAAAGATAVQPAGLTPIETALQTIEAVIPSAASSQNQLADKNFVNSSISTNTANFVGTFETLAELQAVQNPTNNDYGFVIETDAQGNEYYDRYKYVASSQQWLFEYKVESTPFTAAQWAAIQSGITSALVTKLNALPTAQQLSNQLAAKQDTISDLSTIRSGAAAGATAYQKPGTGIQKTDLASAVQTSLERADEAAVRPYNTQSPDGMGYLVLDKDATFASQVTTANTIYEIRYDYALNEDITIPENCVLKFNGGSISGGSIFLSNKNSLLGDNTTITLTGTIYMNTNCVVKGITFVRENIMRDTESIMMFDDDLFANVSSEINTIVSNCTFVYDVGSGTNTHGSIIELVARGNFLHHGWYGATFNNVHIEGFANNAIYIHAEVTDDNNGWITDILFDRCIVNKSKCGWKIESNSSYNIEKVTIVNCSVQSHTWSTYGVDCSKVDRLFINTTEFWDWSQTQHRPLNFSEDCGDVYIDYVTDTYGYSIDGTAKKFSNKIHVQDLYSANRYITHFLDFSGESISLLVFYNLPSGQYYVEQDATVGNKLGVESSRGGVLFVGTSGYSPVNKFYIYISNSLDSDKERRQICFLSILGTPSSDATLSSTLWTKPIQGVTERMSFHVKFSSSYTGYLNGRSYQRAEGNTLPTFNANDAGELFWDNSYNLPAVNTGGSWQYLMRRPIYLYGASTDRPTYGNVISYRGSYFFDSTIKRLIVWTGTKWVESDGATAGVLRSGTFANKPAATDIYIGFKYFCTDKQTTEGATDGIEIIHKGNDVWVDALGRVVS